MEWITYQQIQILKTFSLLLKKETHETIVGEAAWIPVIVYIYIYVSIISVVGGEEEIVYISLTLGIQSLRGPNPFKNSENL